MIKGSLLYAKIRLGRKLNDKDVMVLAGLDAGETIALDPVQAAIYLKQSAPALRVKRMSNTESKMGISGRIAKQFLTTEITPLLALVGLLLTYLRYRNQAPDSVHKVKGTKVSPPST